MAITYYYGSTPVPREEAIEKRAHIQSVYSSQRGSLQFKRGNAEYLSLVNNNDLGLPEFTPIGINKPLSIEILSAYAGDMPRRFLGRKTDLMIVSGLKSYTTYGAAPKVINHLKTRVEDYSFIEISAFDKGSPIVYYAPAVDSSTLYCSFEMVADTFSQNTVSTLLSLLNHAGKLPVFAPAAPILLAGAQMSEMSSSLFNVLFESDAFLKEDIAFRFDTPGFPESVSKQWLICNNEDQEELMAYAPGLHRSADGEVLPALLHRNSGKLYRGDAPYLLVNVDGKKRPELESFSPKLATAAIIERFYGRNAARNSSVTVLEDALTLYNDYNYTKKARSMYQKMQSMSKRSKAYKQARLLYEAYIGNIRNPDWKTIATGN